MQLSKKTVRRSMWLLMCLLFFGANSPVGATSLWASQPGSLFTVQRNWNVGDLVTVLIVEQAQATQTAGTETKKESGVSMGLEVPLTNFTGGQALLNGGDTLKSSGKTVRGGSLTARVTAKVVEVLPNNTLKIEGRQSIVLNGETQEIVLSGMVRQQDVAADNTVLSSYIADAQIAYTGVGAMAAKQSQGLITRFFHWLF